MAGEIVQTLFGVSPESYQQQQSALADQQALQYARLSPFQQANYAIGRGAYQIAGALGGEDPELQLISARNSIAKQINYADLNSIAQGVQMLGNAGDTVGAMQLADVYRKAQSEAALTTQRQREALTPEQRNSDAYAKQFGAPGSPEYQTAFKQRFDALTLKETNISFGGDREAASLELYGKKYIDLSQAERAEVNKSLAKPEPAPNVGADREATSLANFGKPFNKLDQTQQQAVNLAIVKPEPAPSFGADREAASLEMYGVPFIKLNQQQQASVNRSLIKPEKAEPAPTFGNDREAEAFANFGRPFASLTQQQQSFVNSKVAKPEPVATYGNEREAESQANFGKPFGSLNQTQQEFVNKIVGKTAGGVTFGTDANRISLELFDKPFGDLTQPQRAAVNKRVDAEKQSGATKVSVNLSDPTAVAKASLDVMNKWENNTKQDVETASRYKSLQSSVALAQGGNPTADGATIYNIAKIYDPSGAVQEGDKNTILGNPSVPQKVKALAQRVFDGGSLTPEQRNDILAIGTEIVKNKNESLQRYRKQYINKNRALGGTEEDIMNPYENIVLSNFVNPANLIPTDQRQNQKVGPAIPAAVFPGNTPAQAPVKKATGKSGTVKWDDIK
jgi:hypothetical protein